MDDLRFGNVEIDIEILNDKRLDIGRTYDPLARRIEKLITKAEENENDGCNGRVAESVERHHGHARQNEH